MELSQKTLHFLGASVICCHVGCFPQQRQLEFSVFEQPFKETVESQKRSANSVDNNISVHLASLGKDLGSNTTMLFLTIVSNDCESCGTEEDEGGWWDGE